jgi:hypothetical protein
MLVYFGTPRTNHTDRWSILAVAPSIARTICFVNRLNEWKTTMSILKFRSDVGMGGSLASDVDAIVSGRFRYP